MGKYMVQMTVSVEVCIPVKADSLHDALRLGEEMAKDCPVHAKLIRLPKNAVYLWNNDTKVTGATQE